MSSSNRPGPPPLPTSLRTEQGDDTGGLIPYKNPHALIAYYLGLFSLIPFIGFVLALAAVPLGISGLKHRKARPIIRGAAHAWIGIVCGSLSLLAHAAIVFAIAVAAGHHSS